MRSYLKLYQSFVILLVAVAMVIGMFGFSIPVEAKEFRHQYETEMIDPVYDENGELIEFTLVLKDANPALLEQLYKEVEERDINLMTAQMNENGIVPLASSGRGTYKFSVGVCDVIEVLTGYSCASIARYIGLELVNGWYMYNGKKYTGTWQVTRGYIPGCEPRHSEGCFRTTYTKIA